MRISDYRNALSGLDDKHLDELVVCASKTAIRFERATAPPGHWHHAQGSLVNAPMRTTPADGEALLSRRQFLAGFMADLGREFGPGIAMECLQNYCPKDGRPITARTVKVVIDQAEWARTLTCRANDCIISACFDQPPGDDTRPSNQDPTDANHPPLPGIETLEKHAEQFVRSQLIHECRKAPEYSKKTLDDLAAPRLFNKVLNDVLRQYEALRQLPMMTPQALEMTFARLNESAEKIGFEQTLAQIPVHAAKACLYCSLDPDVPDSLMAQAVRRIQGDAPNTPFPETVLAIVVHDFRERFEKIAPANANADPNLSDDTFAQTIALGTQFLDELLGNFLRWQAAIDTAPEFSPRQKMTMTRLLGEGRLNDAEIAAYRSIADAMRRAFAPDILAALTSTEAAAQYLAGQLCRLADKFVDRMILVDTSWAEQSASARLDNPAFQRAIRNFSEPRIALGVFGFTQDEAKTLAGHLAGTTGERIAQILEKETPLPIMIFHLLVMSLRLRTREVGDDFHTLMASQLNDMLHDATEGAGETIDLPGGRRIAEAFWEALRDSRLTLQWADGKSSIDLEDWPDLDDDTKIERLQAGYEICIATMFAGDADQALAFSLHVMALAPSIEALCRQDPILNPIRLPDGTAVVEWLQPATSHHEITLSGHCYGTVQFRYAHHLIAPRGLIDAQGNTRWLAPQQSDLNVACSLTMTQSNNFILCEPMHQICSVHLSDWPKTAYPEPVPEDFRILGHVAQDDLFAHVIASGNAKDINVIMALIAVHAFLDNPSYEGALLIQKNFIDSGIFNPLFDTRALEFPALEEMLAHMNPGPVIEALYAVDAHLEAFLDNWPQTPHHTSIHALRLRIGDFITLPTTEKAFALSDELFEPNGQHHALLTLLNDDILVPLDDALNLVLSPVDDTVFDALEDVLIEIIAQDILPGFIASVRNAAADTSAGAGS